MPKYASDKWTSTNPDQKNRRRIIFIDCKSGERTPKKITKLVYRQKVTWKHKR